MSQSPMLTADDLDISNEVVVQQPTSKTFEVPLLKVLGSLTSYVAMASVPHSAVYEPILSLVGINADAYGIATGTNAFKTHRWIQLAAKSLVDEKLAHSPKKGYWGLTAEGVARSKQLTGEAVLPVPTTQPKVVEPVKLNPKPSIYMEDPYLASIALKMTKCAGFFSLNAPTCHTCPLIHPCQEKQANDLDNLAKVFSVDKTAAITKAPIGATDGSRSPIDLRKFTRRQTIVNYTNNQKCLACNQPIKIEDKCVVQFLDDTTQGSLHVQCAEDNK